MRSEHLRPNATGVLFLLLLLLPVAGRADAPSGTHVSLSARAEAAIPNDEAVVEYRIEAKGADPGALRSQINGISEKIKHRLDLEPGVTQRTTDRVLRPISHYDNTLHRQVDDGWQLAQSGEVTSRNLGRVAAWVEVIEQDGAQVRSLRYQASESEKVAARARLRMRAIGDFLSQAAATARALGAHSYRILNLSTGALMHPPYSIRGEAAFDAVPAPALSAGTSTIQVTVTGEILLPGRRYPVP
ncbi:MAG: SIMPL domain-containing protein [Betaproteobacteria bacterium]|nr:SIMPL domain-containing protein [Betaproteobacteria bacterium]